MEISEAPSSIAGDHPPSTKKIEHRKTMSPRFPPPWYGMDADPVGRDKVEDARPTDGDGEAGGTRQV